MTVHKGWLYIASLSLEEVASRLSSSDQTVSLDEMDESYKQRIYTPTTDQEQPADVK